MKKAMKKYLSLLLAIMMLASTVVINTSAADCNHQIATGDPNYYEVVNPTCEEQGYTIYKCIFCGEEISKGDYKAALDHKFTEEEYRLSQDGTYYERYNICTRQYAGERFCNAEIVEKEDGEVVKYYLVEFYHNRITEAYDDEIDYTDVAATYKAPAKTFSCFVKEGTEAFYEGINIVREKTKEFPRYIHIGWTEEADLEPTRENNLSEEDTVDITAISKNMKLYPVFEGLLSDTNGVITHTVTFHLIDPDTGGFVPGTFPQQVAHGAAPKYSDPESNLYPTPVRNEDVVNTYTFNGFSTKIGGTSGILMDKIESTPIYGDVAFFPTFTAHPKDYTVEFYKEGGATLLQYTKDGEKHDAVFDGVHLETNLRLIDGVNLLNNDKALMEKEADKEYFYLWTGNWALMDADGKTGRAVDISRLEIIEGDYIEIDGEKVIRLVPVYERRRQSYAVDIIMSIPEGEDDDYYRGEADVHVVANNGQLVASGKTDSDGKFRCYLNYQLPFSVTVATADEKYLGETQILFLEKAINPDLEAEINKCLVEMQLNPDYETHCRCIHHVPFIQPIWVRVLNLLYNFFNVKYVCCYDMYSTIGPLLEYTP